MVRRRCLQYARAFERQPKILVILRGKVQSVLELMPNGARNVNKQKVNFTPRYLFAIIEIN